MPVDIEHAINDLTIGPGYARLEGFYSREQTEEARRLVYQLAEGEPQRTTHFLGTETVPTQKRVWNLIEKGRVFQDIASDERLLAILEGIVGDVRLASFAANVLFPGAPAQEPHVDYPYWDLHRPETFPRGLNASFFLEVELLVMLDDFTEENGATALMPHSQHRTEWPNVAEFDHKSIRVLGPAGTLLLFPALTWHAGQANRGKHWRAALLGAYTASASVSNRTNAAIASRRVPGSSSVTCQRISSGCRSASSQPRQATVARRTSGEGSFSNRSNRGTNATPHISLRARIAAAR